MAENQTYYVYVYVYDCHSDQNMDNLLKEMVSLIFNQNLNLIHFYFQECAFSVSSLKLLSKHKWVKL